MHNTKESMARFHYLHYNDPILYVYVIVIKQKGHIVTRFWLAQ